MKTSRHVVLYIISAIWDLTVCWPAVLLIRLFWGTNLRWEAPPDGKETGAGPGLWCDLKLDSWPTRSWYRMKQDGEYKRNPESLRGIYGEWITWGATTLGHGGFYGTGRSQKLVVHGEMKLEESWTTTEAHENIHVEQFEASMLRSFIVGLVTGVVLLALGNLVGAITAWLTYWWMGYWMMGISNWTTAWLRGEEAYRGSHHEEAARAQSRHGG